MDVVMHVEYPEPRRVKKEPEAFLPRQPVFRRESKGVDLVAIDVAA